MSRNSSRQAFMPSFVRQAVKPKVASTSLRRDDYSNNSVNWLVIRQEVLARDGHQCQHPGCRCTTGLEVHHIIPLARGGVTKKWNLITMCGLHHDSRHRK